jgi:DNA-binding response OmpR family regulator
VTVLIVEDDAPVAELLRVLVSDVPGWDAVVAANAFAAFDIFAERHIDLLLLDFNLPGRSGLKLLTLLRADPRWYDPPVIFISAAAEQPGIQTAIRRGQALRCIAKPFDLDDVLNAVSAALP